MKITRGTQLAYYLLITLHARSWRVLLTVAKIICPINSAWMHMWSVLLLMHLCKSQSSVTFGFHQGSLCLWPQSFFYYILLKHQKFCIKTIIYLILLLTCKNIIITVTCNLYHSHRKNLVISNQDLRKKRVGSCQICETGLCMTNIFTYYTTTTNIQELFIFTKCTYSSKAIIKPK